MEHHLLDYLTQIAYFRQHDCSAGKKERNSRCRVLDIRGIRFPFDQGKVLNEWTCRTFPTGALQWDTPEPCHVAYLKRCLE